MNSTLIDAAVSAMKQLDISKLRQQLAQGTPLEQALEIAFHAVRQLNGMEAHELWAQLRAPDRLSAIMSISHGLSMPQFAAFGHPSTEQGDTLNDYDRARWFILNKLDQIAPRPTIDGYFFPEFSHLTRANQRILEIARAHIGCAPTSQKQITLFSCAGALSIAHARTVALRPTTCGSFLRSVLIGAGDTRIEKSMLGESTDQIDMMDARGLKSLSDPGWTDIKSQPHTPVLMSSGDVYYICLDRPDQESGHVGIIESFRVERGEKTTTLVMDTIDGGQKYAGDAKLNGAEAGLAGLGVWTRRLEKRYTRSNSNLGGYWYSQDHTLAVNNKAGRPELRMLYGWLSPAAIESAFLPRRLPVGNGQALHTVL